MTGCGSVVVVFVGNRGLVFRLSGQIESMQAQQGGGKHRRKNPGGFSPTCDEVLDEFGFISLPALQ